MGVQGSKWTPQHRAKFLRSMRLRRKEKEKRQANVTTEQPEALHNGDSPNTDAPIAYAFGKTQAWLESFAQSANIPPATFTQRVAELLLNSTRGGVLWSLDTMPSLQRKTSRWTKRKS